RTAQAETRVAFDVGPMLGKTESVVEVDPVTGSAPAPSRQNAGGLELRLGAVGPHFVSGVAVSAWGATASTVSGAVFGGLALRSAKGHAAELTGSLGYELYD